MPFGHTESSFSLPLTVIFGKQMGGGCQGVRAVREERRIPLKRQQEGEPCGGGTVVCLDCNGYTNLHVR